MFALILELLPKSNFLLPFQNMNLNRGRFVGPDPVKSSMQVLLGIKESIQFRQPSL